MSLDEKYKFDLSLRSLTSQEWDDLDYSRVASMRWVLTVKSEGTSKASLVVLGLQMPDIEHMETASPAM